MRLRTSMARLTLAGFLLLGLAGCGGDELDALQDDPMATARLAGLEELDRRDEQGSDGGLLEKPAPAQVQRVFRIPPSDDPAAVLDEVRTMAEDAGWETTSVTRGDLGFVAERDLDGRRAGLTVSVNADPDRGPAPGLTISLSASVT